MTNKSVCDSAWLPLATITAIIAQSAMMAEKILSCGQTGLKYIVVDSWMQNRDNGESF